MPIIDTERPRPTGFPSPFCPLINGQNPVYYQHAENCSMYYVCGNGFAYAKSCPPGLHFNPAKKVCDFPFRAGCNKGEVMQPKSKTGKNSRCPKENRNIATLIPHETDCSTYYICESGEAIERYCPEELHFNPRLKVCDFPERAKCDL